MESEFIPDKLRVSACIPTYNRAEHLKMAIQCVLNQTFVLDEIIIVDDGSTDNTREIVEKLQKKHQQLVYIWQSNRGEAAARNRCILAARNPIIAFLDSDDTWEPSHIEESMICFSMFPDAAVLFSKYELQDSGNLINEGELSRKNKRRDMITKIAINSIPPYYLLDTEKCFSSVLMGSIGFSNSTLVIDFDRCGKLFLFDESLTIGVDDDFRLKLLDSEIKFAYIDNFHSKYIIHGFNQVTTNIDNDEIKLNKMFSVLRHAHKKLIYCRTVEDYGNIYSEVADKYSFIASYYNEISKFDKAIEWYKLSFSLKKRVSVLKHLIVYGLIGSHGYGLIHKILNIKR